MNSPVVTPLPLNPGRPYPGCRRDDPLSLHISDTRDPHKVRRLLESEGVLTRDEDGQYVAAVTAGEMAAARDTADTALATAHGAQATADGAQATADGAQAAADKARSALDAVARVDVSDLTNDNKRTAAIQAIVTAVRGALVFLVLFCLPVFAEPHGEIDDSVEINLDTVTNALPAVPARPLPEYLHCLDFADTYPADAAWYYAQPQPYGGCSARRNGDLLERNYDWTLDDAAEFVVRVSAAPGRFASVGVANVGTNLTEQLVTSGKPSRYYKCLPGRVVDGVNEKGVVAEVNVVDGPVTNGWHTDGDIHPLAAVRWALDNGTSAQMAATSLVARIKFPDGWAQNFHWMIADASGTWIVEDGAARPVLGLPVMTNFRVSADPPDGPGVERYNILMNPANSITNAWYTRAYRRETNPPWFSEFDGNYEILNAAAGNWETKPKEQHRSEKFHSDIYGDFSWWQTVHTSVYDIVNKVLRVAVQETDDWYTFAVPVTGRTDEAKVREIAEDVASGKANKNGDAYEEFTASTLYAGDFVPSEGESFLQLRDRVFSLETDKANIPMYPGPDNIAVFDGMGGLTDSGKNASDFLPVVDPENIGNSLTWFDGNLELTGCSLVLNGLSTLFLGGGSGAGAGLYLGESGLLTLSDGRGFGNTVACLSDLAAAISASNTTFSNAVLAVGLNIDTNAVAVLNDIADTFGDFPIGGTATTVGGLLAALAASVAWLKRKTAEIEDKVGTANEDLENALNGENT